MVKSRGWIILFGFKCEIIHKFYQMDDSLRRKKNMWHSGMTEYGCKIEIPRDKVKTFMSGIKQCRLMNEMIVVPSLYLKYDPEINEYVDKHINLSMKVTRIRKLSQTPSKCIFILIVENAPIHDDMTLKEVRNHKIKDIFND